MGWLRGSARWPCAVTVVWVSCLAACEPTGRPWRDAAATDSETFDEHTDDVQRLDAGAAHDLGSDVAVDAPQDSAFDAAQPVDAPGDTSDDLTAQDIPAEDATRDAEATDARNSDGCTPAERAVLVEAIALFDLHAYGGSSAFRACVVDAVLSPSPSAYLEELVSRVREFSLAERRCDAALPGDGDAHTVVQMEANTRGAMVVSVSAAALRTRSAVRIAGAMLHQYLHAQGYLHPGTAAGERLHGPPYALERCFALAAGQPEAPYGIARSAMRLEAELQPFGIVRPWIGTNFYAACPPGTWVTGQGVALRRITSPVPVNRVIGMGLRCAAPSGGPVTTLGSSPITGWGDCPAGSVAVGLLGDANNNGVYSARVQCAPWSAVRTPDAPVSTVTLERIAGGFVVARRCPPGQALYAVSGTLDTAGWFKTMALHCHDVDATRPGPFSALPAVGESGGTLPRSSRDTRCADHGVIVGFTGHRMRDGILNRFGALCRSTEGLGEALRFRAVTQGDAGVVSPEHPLPSVGSDPDDPLRPGTAFDLAGGSFQSLRCPEGMAAVGMRVRQGGEPSLIRHVQALCAPLGAWMGNTPPEPSTVNITGDWPGPAGETVQTVRCAPRSFLAGLELSTISPVTTGGVLERIVGLCRSFRP